jgi:heterodisulfide reductase subunit A2
MSKKVVVIGGGIAGMEASSYLSAMKYDVTLIEKEDRLGGHLLNWEKLFPTMRLGSEVLDFLSKGLNCSVKVFTNSDITEIHQLNGIFKIGINGNSLIDTDAILVATGYDLFDARKKEEYGYGIYDNVITSAELEELFTSGKPILTTNGKIPKRIGFIHCVGSRDEKVGIRYCSRVCCVTGVKQSIEVREKLPDSDVYCFYMDMRMYGMLFEALYKEAQEKWSVNFIRGRLSEAFENPDGSILIKVEDTLAGKPMKMSVDLLVLLVGFVPSAGTIKIGKMLDLEFGSNGFYKTRDQHTMTNISNIPGVFFAGTCTAPNSITNTITDARAAAAAIASYLEGYDIEKR